MPTLLSSQLFYKSETFLQYKSVKTIPLTLSSTQRPPNTHRMLSVCAHLFLPALFSHSPSCTSFHTGPEPPGPSPPRKAYAVTSAWNIPSTALCSAHILSSSGLSSKMSSPGRTSLLTDAKQDPLMPSPEILIMRARFYYPSQYVETLDMLYIYPLTYLST